MTTTANLQDPTTMSPEDIDSQLFPLWASRWQKAAYRQQYREFVAVDLFPGARLDDGNGRRVRSAGVQLRQFCQALQSLDDELQEIESAIAYWNAEYVRRGGWTRYILCGNRNGHLHYHGCSSLRITTRLLLVPQASGLDSSDVVGRFGETACTKCFPTAPVAGR